MSLMVYVSLSSERDQLSASIGSNFSGALKFLSASESKQCDQMLETRDSLLIM